MAATLDGVVEQAKRLLWLKDEKANGNAYMAMIALSGLIGWGATVYVLNFIAPRPAWGVIDTQAEVQAAFVWYQGILNAKLFGIDARWLLMGTWGVTWAGRITWGYLRVERKAVFNGANFIWIVPVIVAFGLNAWGVDSVLAVPIWAPWFGVFAIGYIGNAIQVERSWVYWIPGLISLALLLVGLYAKATMTLPLGGMMTIPAGPNSPVPALFGNHLMYPMPYVWAVLGVLHVVPMAVDAYLGGRQLNEDGIPAIKAERQGSTDVTVTTSDD